MHDSSSYGRRRNATKIELLESVFRTAIFDCVFRDTLSDDIQKSSMIVDMTLFILFGKCFVQSVSLHSIQTLSKFKSCSEL